jgi:hypothetical protein
LHQVTAVLDRDDRRNGILALKRMLVGEKILGRHGGASLL